MDGQMDGHLKTKKILKRDADGRTFENKKNKILARKRDADGRTFENKKKKILNRERCGWMDI